MESDYISLQEATKYCNYSQEYLSLRARQGKLKAVKFGRNWVTKKEWLEEYLGKVEEHKKVKIERFDIARFLKITPPRFALTFALALTLLISGVVFGKESLQNVFDSVGNFVVDTTKSVFGVISSGAERVESYVIEFNENFEQGVAQGYERISQMGQIGLMEISQIRQMGKMSLMRITQMSQMGLMEARQISQMGLMAINEQLAVISSPEVLKYTLETFREYGQWLLSQALKMAERAKKVASKIAKGYTTANEFLEEKISQASRVISQPFVRGYQFLTQPRRVSEMAPPEKVIREKVVTEKVIEKETVKEVEVERITKVEPIREITRETIVTKIDDQELQKLKTQIAKFALWEVDIKNLQNLSKKLQFSPSYTQAPTAPIYIGSQGLEVGGVGSFTSLGVSGSAGIGNLGVGGSASIGSSANDKLTVNAASTFSGPVTIQNTFTFLNGSNIFQIDRTGQLSLVSTSTPQLTIKYDGGKYSTLSVDSSGTTTLYSTGNIILNPENGEIKTTANFVDLGGSTVRAVGERVFRAAAPIFRYGMPAETASTSFVRISKDFPSGQGHPLVSEPPLLPGATRVYRLLISYSDTLATTATSSWRIATSSPEATIVEFSLPGLGLNDPELNEGKPYLTQELPIPNENWHIDVKVPSGKIRIFNIYLLAYDKINQ